MELRVVPFLLAVLLLLSLFLALPRRSERPEPADPSAALASALLSEASQSRSRLQVPECWAFDGESVCSRAQCFQSGGNRTYCWPDLWQAGLAKGGSTLLYMYLSSHPAVARPRMKEPQFFGRRRDIDWGGSHWDLHTYFDRLLGPQTTAQVAAGAHTIDASPSYFCSNPETPEQLWTYVPWARIVTIVRDPVKRAWSDYFHFHRHKCAKPADWPDCLADVRQLLEHHLAGVESCNNARRNKHFFFDPACTHKPDFAGASRPGKPPRILWDLTAYHLARWYKFFEPKNVLIIRLEDLAEDPVGTMNRVFAHFDLPPHTITPRPATNVNKYPEIPPDLKKRLEEFYAPHNRVLARMLNDDRFLWQDKNHSSLT